MITLRKSRSATAKLLRESLAGFAFDIAGIIAGIIIAFRLDVFSTRPWSIAVYPAILSARGIISGLLSGRLSTALHLGTISPRIFANTKDFRLLFNAIVTLTFEVSLVMGLFCTVTGSFLWGMAFSDFPSILGVISATMTLGLCVTLATVGVCFISFKYGLDPDVFLYPAVSAVSDIFITLSYIFVLSLLPNRFGQWFLTSLSLMLLVLGLVNLLRNSREKEFVKTLKESFFTLIFVAIVVNVTGTVLNQISLSLTGEGGIYMALYIAFPALIAVIGDVGAVVGSTATTKLAVGLLDVSLSEMRNHLREILCAWAASLVMYTLFSFLALSISRTLRLELFLDFTLLLFITNLIAVSAIVLISYAIALITFQKGLDPDNFVIPIESALADSVTSTALLVALFLITWL